MAPTKYILSGDLVPKLIKEVCAHESLWNPENSNYTDRVHALSTWKEIAEKLGMSEDVCKTKWKNLRDLFRRETKKFKVTNLEDYPGRWRFYKSMWFLQKAGLFLTANDPDIESLEIELEREEDNSDVNEEINPLEPFVKCEPFNNENDRLNDYEDEMPAKRRKYTENDFDLMYLQSLTPYLSQLEPIRKLVVRSKIQDIILNEIAAQNATVTSRDRKKANT